MNFFSSWNNWLGQVCLNESRGQQLIDSITEASRVALRNNDDARFDGIISDLTEAFLAEYPLEQIRSVFAINYADENQVFAALHQRLRIAFYRISESSIDGLDDESRSFVQDTFGGIKRLKDEEFQETEDNTAERKLIDLKLGPEMLKRLQGIRGWSSEEFNNILSRYLQVKDNVDLSDLLKYNLHKISDEEFNNIASRYPRIKDTLDLYYLLEYNLHKISDEEFNNFASRYPQVRYDVGLSYFFENNLHKISDEEWNSIFSRYLQVKDDVDLSYLLKYNLYKISDEEFNNLLHLKEKFPSVEWNILRGLIQIPADEVDAFLDEYKNIKLSKTHKLLLFLFEKYIGQDNFERIWKFFKSKTEKLDNLGEYLVDAGDWGALQKLTPEEWERITTNFGEYQEENLADADTPDEELDRDEEFVPPPIDPAAVDDYQLSNEYWKTHKDQNIDYESESGRYSGLFVDNKWGMGEEDAQEQNDIQRENIKELGELLSQYDPDDQRFPIRTIVDLKKNIAYQGWDKTLKTEAGKQIDLAFVHACKETNVPPTQLMLLLQRDDIQEMYNKPSQNLIPPQKMIFLRKPLIELIRTGTRGGKSNNPKAMFNELKNIASEAGIKDVREIMMRGVPDNLKMKIIELVQKYKVEGQAWNDIYVAEIHDRKDPRAWLSGNYLANCMAIDYGDSTADFAAGRHTPNQKLIEYLTFPDTQIFSISKNNRMIASSVVMKGKLPGGGDCIILDNIETHPNYGVKNAGVIGRLYEVFWNKVGGNIEIQIGSKYSTNKPYMSAAVDEQQKAQLTQDYYYSDFVKADAWDLPKISPDVIHLVENIISELKIKVH